MCGTSKTENELSLIWVLYCIDWFYRALVAMSHAVNGDAIAFPLLDEKANWNAIHLSSKEYGISRTRWEFAWSELNSVGLSTALRMALDEIFVYCADHTPHRIDNERALIFLVIEIVVEWCWFSLRAFAVFTQEFSLAHQKCNYRIAALTNLFLDDTFFVFKNKL